MDLALLGLWLDFFNLNDSICLNNIMILLSLVLITSYSICSSITVVNIIFVICLFIAVFLVTIHSAPHFLQYYIMEHLIIVICILGDETAC